MRLGVPTEIKSDEYRVGITPAGVRELVQRGHEVLVQSGAGEGSAISDDAYAAQGAAVLTNADDVFAETDTIVKVKEPSPRRSLGCVQTSCSSPICTSRRTLS